MAEIARTTFTVSRTAEFFSEKELEMQMGAGRESWLPMLLKELIDNALDAAEGAGVISPEITITVGADELMVADNGPGIPPETVASSLDYLSRTSSNNLYVSPTRGQLGNALKCLYAAGFVAHGRGDVTITAKGVEHRITASFDSIRNEPVLDHQQILVPPAAGTFVRIAWPGAASELEDSLFTSATELAWSFGLFNPHVRIRVLDGERDPDNSWYAAPRSAADWVFKKWKPLARPPASWYYRGQFKALLCAHLASSPTMFVRDFIKQFAGMSGSWTQSAVLDELTLQRTTITAAFTTGGAVLEDKVQELHDVIAAYGGEPVKAKRLGVIGRTLHERLHQIREGSTAYAKVLVEDENRPFVVEGWFAVSSNAERTRVLVVGANNSPLREVPHHLIQSALSDNFADYRDPITVVLHMVCPAFRYTDRGKTLINFTPEQWTAIRTVIDAITKNWKKLKARQRRDAQSTEKELERLSRQQSGVTTKEAAWAVMADAYMKASNNNTLPANARQVMYAARGAILNATGKPLSDTYFTQTLLPDFISENFELTKDWDVVYDDRGTFMEPHTRIRVAMGTLKVRNYINSWCAPDTAVLDVSDVMPNRIHTCGPSGRYSAAIFIEKEGFTALFEAARTAELYDVAIFSTKGMSTTAARRLVDELSQQGIPILLLHDFDFAGLAIARTIQNDGRRYQFNASPIVHSLGLRLEQAQEMELESEPFEFSKQQKKDPRHNLRECGATDEELAFLVTRGTAEFGGWGGERIELNAMTSAQFIAFVHGQLDAMEIIKVVPDEATLAAAYRRAAKIRAAEEAMEAALAAADDEEVEIPNDLREQVTQRLMGQPIPWDAAVHALAGERVEDED
ncbi:ATP-binding protein [Synechococcus sp. 1G10]|uniref:ATP-binding protein n=1 Tax=Synechococcus sp. 1G10 TaxID=2025605 RepID=UPI00130319F3|nr:ATP-binding protein [Synechococcus sp. 1G10]